LGTHLCRSLSKKHKLIVLSRNHSTSAFAGDENDIIDFISGDITDFEIVDRACHGVDCLINLASTVVPSTSNKDPVFDVNTNLIGALNTLKASVKNNVQKYIFLSSGGTIYGNKFSSKPHKETDSTEPICSYGIVKLAIEKYIHMFSDLYGLPYAILRLSNPYGPGYSLEKPQGAIHHFISSAINNQPITIWGDGTQQRDFIFIDDVVEAITKVVDLARDQSLLNIGSSSSTSLNNILEIIEEVSGSPLNIIYQESRDFDVHKSELDITVAKNVLQWEPRTTLLDGIRKTYSSSYNAVN